MDINEDDYILAFAFLDDPSFGNIMMTVKRSNEKFIGETRIRKYNLESKTPFDGKDEKETATYELKVKTEDEALKKLETLFESVKSERVFSFTTVDFQIVKGDMHTFMQILKTKPYVHMKVEKAKH